MSSHTLRKGVHIIILEYLARALVVVSYERKVFSNLTEDGSKEGRYLLSHLQVNRRIIRNVALLKADVLSC